MSSLERALEEFRGAAKRSFERGRERLSAKYDEFGRRLAGTYERAIEEFAKRVRG
ncbi:MAG: hypothetical protein ABDH61_01365 [Acidilobaceae archaeon]